MTAWWKPRKPDEIIPIPWLHSEAINVLDELVQPEWNLLEHGCGGSTLWFADRCKSVTCIEGHTEWRAKVEGMNIPNVRFNEWPLGTYDMVFIDGPSAGRAYWVLRSLDFKPKVVVLDNSNRPDFAVARGILEARAKSVMRIAPREKYLKYAVTEFFHL